MEHSSVEHKDPYLRLCSDIKPRLGFSALDEANKTPFKSLHRYFDGDSWRASIKPMRRDHEEILCIGAALAIDRIGIVRHAWSEKKLVGFVGFLAENSDPDKAIVARYGNIVLKVEGLAERCEGLPVYAHGPDSFSLEKGQGLEVGKVRFIEDIARRRASVAFRAFDEFRPLDMKVTRHGRREI